MITFSSIHDRLPKNKFTSLRLSKFEYCKIIGTRALQLDNDAPPFIDTTLDDSPEITSVEIAKKEFLEKKIPFLIRRQYPDGTNEVLSVKDMTYND